MTHGRLHNWTILSDLRCTISEVGYLDSYSYAGKQAARTGLCRDFLPGCLKAVCRPLMSGSPRDSMQPGIICEAASPPVCCMLLS